jgi:dsDNA-binding SOS-regulon protein
MAVITKYVVEHKGVEKLVTTDKKEAEKYDRMLDVADNLSEYLTAKGIELEEDTLEDISILLSKNKDDIGKLFKGTQAQILLQSEEGKVVDLDKKKA